MMQLAATCATLLVFTACTEDNAPPPPAPPHGQQIAPEAPEPPVELEPIIEAPIADQWEYDIDNPESPFYMPAIGRFGLTDSERANFEEYIRTGDLAVLYGVEPVSMIKIWIQAGIEGEIEREFSLFHPDTLDGETFEMYRAANQGDGMAGTARVRQRFADIFFSQLEDGDFTMEDGRAVITFDTETGERLTLATRLSEDGIWLVERLLF